ncbi:hypothetical protein IQ241_20300 [Romeria aff. gracilis LEGE 07310]|uniref:Response regulatory domain-containing protein n=1 Tax=Vasconcelosia minhoensis LEGE 07310 TaxID=915328 RepID=A0A8J7DPF5_9CYAN|nr:hypothetical protein [Romeria gracilis]MBE9079610.1 hypothetical protein [Romeria aff. gracilis LEGE 07310]
MTIPQGYILVLGQQPQDFLDAQLQHLSYLMVLTDSADQAVARVEQERPYLVILSGNHQNWSQPVVQRLRDSIWPAGVTIVALTEPDEPSWFPPGQTSGIDGFLVKPLSRDILSAVVESAVVKQFCG